MITITGLLLSALFQLEGDPAGNAELIRRRDAVLNAPFLKNVEWEMDFDRAVATSARTGRLIFTYFTKSYAY